MLVLSRKAGESIMIGDDIEVVVTRVQGGRVVVGVRAPQRIGIRRGELPEWKDTEEFKVQRVDCKFDSPMLTAK